MASFSSPVLHMILYSLKYNFILESLPINYYKGFPSQCSGQRQGWMTDGLLEELTQHPKAQSSLSEQ